MIQRRVFDFAVLAGLVLAAGCAKKAEEKTEAAPPAEAPHGPPPFAVEAPDSLRALAKITVDSAATLVRAQVPGGVIAKAELEREHNALNWSFDLKVAGQLGLYEVNVNAVTGAVSPVEHESATAEAREARKDSADAHRPASSTHPAAPATKRP